MTLEEAKLGSVRAMTSTEVEDNEKVSKDMIEESRLKAIEDIRKYQAEIVRWQYRKVLKNITPGHLMLQRGANSNTKGKVQVKWEGPYLVLASNRPRSYRLRDMQENEIPRSWNADELWRYYV
jgi:hypothetical protein